MLTLPIKKKWFEMIRNGVKLEEYREIKPYYKKTIREAVAGEPDSGRCRKRDYVPEWIQFGFSVIYSRMQVENRRGKT